jgi:N-methylhydantoinase B
LLNPGTSREVDLGDTDIIRVEPGDVVSIWSPGGGGYGSPFDRGPEAVLRDFRCGYVSILAAKEEYGVVINDAQVDLGETRRCRTKLKREKSGTEFDFGPERVQYESVWSDGVYDALNTLIMGLPGAWRHFARKELFTEISSRAKKGAVDQNTVTEAWDYIRTKFAVDY